MLLGELDKLKLNKTAGDSNALVESEGLRGELATALDRAGLAESRTQLVSSALCACLQPVLGSWSLRDPRGCMALPTVSAPSLDWLRLGAASPAADSGHALLWGHKVLQGCATCPTACTSFHCVYRLQGSWPPARREYRTLWPACPCSLQRLGRPTAPCRQPLLP